MGVLIQEKIEIGNLWEKNSTKFKKNQTFMNNLWEKNVKCKKNK